jgi:hypothetical protein
MKDYRARLEKLRKDAAESELIMISGLATGKAKREFFARLAEHFQSAGERR